jgi:AmmeMemoRadiSam system protein B/AmmeMemoRadiSam system protein A
MRKFPLVVFFIFLLLIGIGVAMALQGKKQMDNQVREPAVAGQFYPASAAMLQGAVEKFLQDARPVRVKKPVAIIVPHAGYIYSGQIAADGFKQAAGGDFDVVVILGTNHTSAEFRKVSLYDGSGFRTPLGVAPIDQEIVQALAAADPDCTLEKSVHEREHSLEVQVPFVQVLFPKAKIVPAIVGTADLGLCNRFGQALASVLRNRKALIVASSDLSHYPSAEDPATLRATIAAQRERRVSGLHTSACGEAPILTAMAAAKALGATRGVVISYAHSGDVSVGDRSRVVGYGAVALSVEPGAADTSVLDEVNVVPEEPSIRPTDKKALLRFARETISRFLSTQTVPLARGFSPDLQYPRGVFVTLKKHEQLRGCIGRIVPDAPLLELVGAMALQSAFEDPRFKPVTANELGDLEIEISVLTPMKQVKGPEAIVVGPDGVLLKKGGRSAVFLPQVAPEQGWGRDEMLDHLSMKAGLPKGSWREGAEFFTFQAIVFSEKEFQ